MSKIKFTIADSSYMTEYIRKLRVNTISMEDTATQICKYLYENLMDEEGNPACSLVRFFITYPYHLLPPKLQAFAQKQLQAIKAHSEIRCLTLLGTAGEIPEWNSRESSNGHQAIPLISEEVVKAFPMISNMVKQFGLDVKKFIKPSANFFLEHGEHLFNAFYVPVALNSP